VKAFKPRAVFCIGQGRPGAIRLEQRAENERIRHPDNRKQLPPSDVILENGPAAYESAFPFDAVRKAYRGPSLAFEPSREAGGYLCEECLYSQETVRAEAAWTMDVAFLHVPPLNSQMILDGKPAPCDPKTLAAFAAGWIEAWATVTRKEALAQSR
jgi:pyrrolidone-carboxylate peptidase